MMTDDQILEVVRAHKEGKKIECRYMDEDSLWGTWSSGIWKFSEYQYRVALEPRKPLEWNAWYLPESKGLTDAWMEMHQAAGWRPIKVREVASSGEPTVISSTVKTFDEINPLSPRKPREWWIHPKCFPDVEFEKDRILTEQPVNPAWIHVREVLE